LMWQRRRFREGIASEFTPAWRQWLLPLTFWPSHSKIGCFAV